MQATDSHVVVCLHQDVRLIPSTFRNIAIARREGPMTFLETLDPTSLTQLQLASPAKLSPRVLDRFYLLASEPNRTSLQAAFFDYIAANYESLIDRNRNIQNIANLCTILGSLIGELDGVDIVDFGCGTGLSAKARPDLNFIGVDRCGQMRQLAQGRGLNPLSLTEFSEVPDNSVQGALSSYVLHFGLSVNALETIWAKLAPGGALVANFHKGAGIHHTNDVFGRLGADTRQVFPEGDDGTHGPYFGYIKRREGQSVPGSR